MQCRLLSILLVLIVVVAATLPAGVRAMPMPDGTNTLDIQSHCTHCPRAQSPGAPSDKMADCRGFACSVGTATVPIPPPLPVRRLQGAGYVAAAAVPWAAEARAPDPFPPRVSASI